LPRSPAIFSKIIKKTLWNVYDALGFLIRSNFYFFLGSLFIVTIPVSFVSLVGVIDAHYKSPDSESASFWKSYQKYFWVSSKYFSGYALFVAMVFWGWGFFMSTEGWIRYIGLFLETMAGWLLILFGLVSVYAPSVIVQAKGKIPIFQVWTNCFMQFLAFPWLSFCLWGGVLAWVLLCVWTKILMLLVASALGVFMTNTYNLSRAFARGEDITLGERSWRSFWRPWEGSDEKTTK